MKSSKRKLTLLGGAALLFTAGCVRPPKFTTPQVSAPPAWNLSQEQLSTQMTAQPLDEAWWNTFHDPELTSLVERLAKQNIEIRVAAEHILQAQDVRKITRSASLPSMNASVSYSHARLSQNGWLSLVQPSPGSGPEYNLFADNLSAQWNLDLSGRVRHQVEAANAAIKMSSDEIHALEVAEVSELAQNYMQLRGLQATHALILREIALLKQKEVLIEQQQQQGVATLNETSMAKADIEALEGAVPGIEAAEHARIDAMGYLLALNPGVLDQELRVDAPQPLTPSIVAVGLPGDLVRRRPDVSAAENALKMATAETGVAAAQFYPDVALSGDFGLQGLHVLNMFGMASRAFDVGPVLSIPLFQGGRLTGTLKLRESQQKEAALNFQKTLLAAWRDVDTDIDTYKQVEASLSKEQASVQEHKLSFQVTQQQFAQGATTKIAVIQAEQAYLESILISITTTTMKDQQLVLLYEALGGGWSVVDAKR